MPYSIGVMVSRQHIARFQIAVYVALLPQRCETAEEWMATVDTRSALTKPSDEV